MDGMSRTTGKTLSGFAHVHQSIVDILTTPIGSRVMRRDYGSKLFELVDAPGTQEKLLDITAAVAIALDVWEPRFRLGKVSIYGPDSEGKTTLALSGEYLPEGRRVELDVIL
uniref:IraD/Gp25-like domain-containing protein n=1 Tax=Candidatus Kentrum sp. LFY TaxID=2126342 RepID=A0A450W6T9_9GAMM|nr:MAG: hypothetical protein BECKLFY1418C_GA0070996_100180 [Candidatus Kentron sp. LFY]